MKVLLRSYWQPGGRSSHASRLRLLGAVAILSNVLLMFWRLGSSSPQGGNVRIIDVMSVALVLALSWEAVCGRLRLPHSPFTAFVLALSTSVALSTGWSYLVREFPPGELPRVVRACIRLYQTLLLGLGLRMLLRTPLLAPALQAVVLGSAPFTVYSTVSYLRGESDYVRMRSFVPMEAGADGVVNELGALFGAVALVAAGLVATQRPSPHWRAVNLALASAAGAAALLTFSRSALAAMLLGWALLALFTRGRARAASWAAAALGAVWVAVSDSGFALSLIDRITSTLSPGTGAYQSMMIRFSGWSSAWELFRDHPVLGVGYACYATFNRDGWITPESYPLEILADLGLIGAATWMGLLTYVAVLVWRLSQRRSAHPKAEFACLVLTPAVAALLIGNITGNNFFDPGLFLLFLSMVVGLEITWREVRVDELRSPSAEAGAGVGRP